MARRSMEIRGHRALLPALGLAISLLGMSLTAPQRAAAQSAPAQAALAQTSVTSAESEWRQDLDRWRTRRAQEIHAPDGWLTLVALDWLKPGANSIGAAADNQIQLHADVPDHIGMLIVSGKTVQLLPIAGGLPDDLTIDGKPAHEGPLAVEGAKPSIIGWHGVSMIVLARGDRFALRIKDANAPARKAFHGLNWYAADPNLSVTAQWIPFTPPQSGPRWICLRRELRSSSLAARPIAWSRCSRVPAKRRCSSSCAMRPANPPPTRRRGFCTRRFPTMVWTSPAR